MDQKTFDEYVKNRYEYEVMWYDQKSIRNKRISYVLRLITLCLSSIVPVIAALQLEFNGLIYATIFISAIVAIATGLIGYGKFEELWHSYRTTCETLKKELNYYKCRCGEYCEANDPERIFVERVESLISKENTEWVAMIKDCNKKGNNT